MRKKLQHIFSIFFLLFACSVFTVTVKADTAGDLTVQGREVSVSLHLPEGKTETITSLRMKLYISLKSGKMGEPSFHFADGLISEVKDAAITQDGEGEYIVDIILSGKQTQDIFGDSEDVFLGTLTLAPAKDKAFTAEVGITAADGEKEEDALPDIQYVDSSGITMETLTLTNADPVTVEYGQPETPEPDDGSNTGESATTQTKPVKPEGETVSVARTTDVAAVYKNTSKVLVSWKGVENADGYEIWRSRKKNGTYSLKSRVKASKTSKKMKHKVGKAFYYKVRAFVTDADGRRVYGEFSAPTAAVPAKPKLSVKINYEQGRAVLTWKKAARADGYKIYRYNARTRSYRAVARVKNRTSWSVSCKAGTSYIYRVRAFEKKKNGRKSFGAFSRPQTVRIK